MTQNTVKLTELTAIFADQEGRLRRLVATGKVKEVTRGRVGLVEAVRAFLDDLRAELAAKSATKSSEMAREARADVAQLRLAELRREIIPTEDADAAVAHVAGAINSALTVLPTRITRDIRDRRELNDTIFRLREQIAKGVGALG